MIEAAFRPALLNPDTPVPPGLTDPQGRPAGKRFDVYRNNVTVGLRQALRDGFPLLSQVLGDTNFATLALVFLRAHPPESRMMKDYGTRMPDFLRGFAPLAHLGWLSDLARLDLALRDSYHAADSTPLPADRLANLPEADFLAARLHLAPSLRLIRSDWPLWDLRAAILDPTAPPPVPGPQDILICRPEFDPAPHLLPPGGGAFVAGLLAGHSVAQAMDAAGPDLNLTATLTLLLAQSALTDLEIAR